MKIDGLERFIWKNELVGVMTLKAKKALINGEQRKDH